MWGIKPPQNTTYWGPPSQGGQPQPFVPSSNGRGSRITFNVPNYQQHLQQHGTPTVHFPPGGHVRNPFIRNYNQGHQAQFVQPQLPPDGGVPPSDWSMIPTPPQRITPGDAPINEEVITHAIPTIVRGLDKVRVAQQVKDRLSLMIDPRSPQKSPQIQASICWFVYGKHQELVQKGILNANDPITVNTIHEGTRDWCWHCLKDLVLAVENACREENMRVFHAQYGGNFIIGQTLDHTYSHEVNQMMAGLTQGATEMTPQISVKPDTWGLKPVPQAPMTHSVPVVPPLSDVERGHLEKLKAWMDVRGLPWVVHGMDVTQIREFLAQWKEKINLLFKENMIWLTVEERKLFKKQLEKRGVKNVCIPRTLYEQLVKESKRTKPFESPKRARLVSIEFKKVEPPKDKVPNTVLEVEAFKGNDPDETVVKQITVKRPVWDENHVVSDTEEEIESDTKYLNSVKYEKLVTLPIPTEKMMEVKESLEKLLQNDKEHLGAGTLFITEVLPLMEDNDAIEMNKFLVDEFNKWSAVNIRLEDYPDLVMNIQDVEDLLEENFEENLAENEELRLLEQYGFKRKSFMSLLDNILVNLILKPGSFITAEDPNLKHILLTTESDNFCVGKKFKEDLFIEGTDEERKEWVQNFLDTFTTFRLQKCMIITNLLEEEMEEDRIKIELTDDLEDTDQNIVTFVSCLSHLQQINPKPTGVDKFVTIKGDDPIEIKSYAQCLARSFDETGNKVIQHFWLEGEE